MLRTLLTLIELVFRSRQSTRSNCLIVHDSTIMSSRVGNGTNWLEYKVAIHSNQFHLGLSQGVILIFSNLIIHKASSSATLRKYAGKASSTASTSKERIRQTSRTSARLATPTKLAASACATTRSLKPAS